MIKPRERIEYFAGRRRELVDDAVARAVLRLLRERTTAELIATDTYPYGNGHVTPHDFNYRHILEEFDVRYVDSNLPPFATFTVPGGGSMFDQYVLNAVFDEADEVISIAKMKNHAFMGITLTLKNLFGLPPMIPPEGRTRSYYHHLIRLSYVLPDLGINGGNMISGYYNQVLSNNACDIESQLMGINSTNLVFDSFKKLVRSR